MQDQPADTGTSLQQQQTGLQQNAPSLQPNQSPTTAPNSSNFLNNYRGSRELTVQDQGEPLSSGGQNTPNEAAVPFTILALIIVPIAVAIAVFWPNKKPKSTTVLSSDPEPDAPVAAKPKSKTAKGKKKPTRRQRTAKR